MDCVSPLSIPCGAAMIFIFLTSSKSASALVCVFKNSLITLAVLTICSRSGRNVHYRVSLSKGTEAANFPSIAESLGRVCRLLLPRWLAAANSGEAGWNWIFPQHGFSDVCSECLGRGCLRSVPRHSVIDWLADSPRQGLQADSANVVEAG